MKRLFTLLSFFIFSASQAQEQAEAIFKQLAPSLYQIRIIDIASGEKSSIGSGFQITAQGLIATNYHVISGFARYPHKYRIEYLDHLGDKGELSLESVDIINDLALVKREAQDDIPFFNIASKAPSKGEELYSLGNPHDLGMIVVPGTYNGLKKNAFNDRIHFTGSVNSGMSGGPVVNHKAEVVGVNVATSGNQIGFLVPHDKLVTLFNQYKQNKPDNIEAQMAHQLMQNQKKLISDLLNNEWQLKELGAALIPTISVPYIRCWGDSTADKKDAEVLVVAAKCGLEEDTYIESNLITGSIEMEFRYMKSLKLNPTKFYRLYQNQVSRVMPSNKATKDDITEFECQHDLVTPQHQGINNKAVFCVRAYKDFPQLYDVLYLGISVDKDQQALLSHFTISGVAKDSAQAFTQQFMESVSWN